MKTPADCTTMADIRAEIDRLDEDLVAAVRAPARPISTARARSRPRSACPRGSRPRVEEVVANVRRHAVTYGLPPELVEKLWRRLIDWSIAREESRAGAGQSAREG